MNLLCRLIERLEKLVEAGEPHLTTILDGRIFKIPVTDVKVTTGVNRVYRRVIESKRTPLTSGRKSALQAPPRGQECIPCGGVAFRALRHVRAFDWEDHAYGAAAVRQNVRGSRLSHATQNPCGVCFQFPNAHRVLAPRCAGRSARVVPHVTTLQSSRRGRHNRRLGPNEWSRANPEVSRQLGQAFRREFRRNCASTKSLNVLIDFRRFCLTMPPVAAIYWRC